MRTRPSDDGYPCDNHQRGSAKKKEKSRGEEEENFLHPHQISTAHLLSFLGCFFFSSPFFFFFFFFAFNCIRRPHLCASVPFISLLPPDFFFHVTLSNPLAFIGRPYPLGRRSCTAARRPRGNAVRAESCRVLRTAVNEGKAQLKRRGSSGRQPALPPSSSKRRKDVNLFLFRPTTNGHVYLIDSSK